MAAMVLVVTLALYFAATVSFLAYLLWPSKVLSKVSLGMTAVGFVAHTIALMARMVGATDVSPPDFHEALSFFSWMLILVFLAVEFRHRLHVLGSFIVPLALVSLSLGVGTMLIYGAYVSTRENLPVIGSLVTLITVISQIIVFKFDPLAIVAMYLP